MRASVLCVLLASGCAIARQDLGANDDASTDASTDAVTDAPPDAAMAPASAIAAGRRTTMVLRPDGTVLAWGANASGELGLAPLSAPDTCTLTTGSVRCVTTPTRVPALHGVESLALGMHHGCALREGRVLCWGLDLFGMLGTGRTQDDPQPAPLDVGIDDAVAIAVGDYTSCALHRDGGVSCWGLASARMLGLEAGALEACTVSAAWVDRFELPFAGGAVLPCSLTPRRVPGLLGVRALAIGGAHLCAALEGSVVCMGSAERGQLGDGSTTGTAIAPVVALTHGAMSVVAGSRHACVLDGGALSCWGDDGLGQIGVLPATATCGASGCVPSATSVTTLSGAVASVAAGDLHTCVVIGTDALCFGNADGDASGARNESCDDGPCRTASAGVVATGLRGPIAAGTEHTCAVTLEDEIVCWGTGRAGELGSGVVTMSPTPLRVVLPD